MISTKLPQRIISQFGALRNVAAPKLTNHRHKVRIRPGLIILISTPWFPLRLKYYSLTVCYIQYVCSNFEVK